LEKVKDGKGERGFWFLGKGDWLRQKVKVSKITGEELLSKGSRLHSSSTNCKWTYISKHRYKNPPSFHGVVWCVYFLVLIILSTPPRSNTADL
jgi:hypothetical protein